MNFVAGVVTGSGRYGLLIVVERDEKFRAANCGHVTVVGALFDLLEAAVAGSDHPTTTAVRPTATMPRRTFPFTSIPPSWRQPAAIPRHDIRL
jgi:hypothetical protein